MDAQNGFEDICACVRCATHYFPWWCVGLSRMVVYKLAEAKMMLVEFKAKTYEFDVIGEDRNREQLPFQSLPEMNMI